MSDIKNGVKNEEKEIKEMDEIKEIKEIKEMDEIKEKEIEEPISEIHDWDNLEIHQDILRGIYSYGFEKPSPIQRKAIVPIIQGRDAICSAQSGTGKTATFCIGALSHIDLESHTTQVMILSHTRELSKQTMDVMLGIGSMMKGLKVQLLVGGGSVDKDAGELKTNIPHVVIGTPGRMFDMLRRNHIVSKNIKLVIFDEADELLSSGFEEQVYNIFQCLKLDVQVAIFSATLPSSIYDITSKFMRNPVKIVVKTEQLTLEGISQYYVALDDDRQKYEVLKDLYSILSVSQCIIYCNSVKRVMDLHQAMIQDGFPVCCIHSNMEKHERDSSLSEFRKGKFRVLISSNVTARGIDIQQVSSVINFDVPKDVHTYLHRIGRSGRWGRKGMGINFITKHDVYKLKEVEGYYACQIKELPSNFDKL